jgi:hypothetical protein
MVLAPSRLEVAANQSPNSLVRVSSSESMRLMAFGHHQNTARAVEPLPPQVLNEQARRLSTLMLFKAGSNPETRPARDSAVSVSSMEMPPCSS